MAMDSPTAIAIYFLIWWVVLFAVLPFGVRNRERGAARQSSRDTIPARRRVPRAQGQADLDHDRRGGACSRSAGRSTSIGWSSLDDLGDAVGLLR